MSNTSINEDEFQKFREFFYRKTGIQFESSKRYFVDKRLLERMRATKSETFRAYFMLLRFEASGDELQVLTNLMTVNETYFFREEYQFKCLVQSMMPLVAAKKKAGDPVRLWIMPSSSGEEAYSVAIYLLEYWAGIDDYDVEIIASDIDTKILEQARAGTYSARSVAALPDSILRKYFSRTSCEYPEYQICEDLRRSVEFTRMNINEPLDVRLYQRFDIVFCRNLLIYFDDQSRKTAAENFYEALVPGGFIGLGHSESMSRISSLYTVRKFPDAIVYQKPLA